VSGPKQITVTRTYRYEPDDCARALAFLLTASVRNEGGPPTAPDDAKKESKHIGANKIIPE
jgi:hypothetical protein